MKIYPLLPVVVRKVLVLGRRQNSVCGLSFGRSRGRTIADGLKNFQMCKKSFIKNGKETRMHRKNLLAAASCCWHGGGVGQETKLSLWAEFRPFLWEDHSCSTGKNQDVATKSKVRMMKKTKIPAEN
jgi:hypothetical protein